MNRRVAIPALCISLFGGSYLHAQQPAPKAQTSDTSVPVDQSRPSDRPDAFRLNVTSQIVNLDVVVTDRHGNVVNNLREDDFGVFEDKQPQIIRNFDRPLLHALPSNIRINSTGELDKLAPEAPVSIVVLDEINTEFQDEAFARYSLQKYLKTQNDILSQPTMLVAVTLQHFMVLRDYTTSKKEILDALDHHLVTYPWHLQGGVSQGDQIAQAFSSLWQVAEATVGHRGHKNMIWIGRGFPDIRMQDQPHGDQSALQNAIEHCTNMLRDARITLYTIDPAGLSVEPPMTDENGNSTEDPFGGNIDFNALATATGGQSFYGSNDVDHLIAKSMRDGANFYTLSYKPSNRIDGANRFRSIRVVMKDPNLTATTRQGYYVHPPAELEAEGRSEGGNSTFDLVSAAGSMMIYDGLPVTVTRSTADPNSFTIHIGSSGINWTNEYQSPTEVEIALVVASFDRKGKMLHRDSKMLAMHLKANTLGSSADLPSLNLHTRISTAPPAARIRFVVQVGTNGKVGADNVYLVDKKTLSDPATGIKAAHHR